MPICQECFFASHKDCFGQILSFDNNKCDICKREISYAICLTHNIQICEIDFFQSQIHRDCEVYRKNKLSPKILEAHSQAMAKCIEGFQAEKQIIMQAINLKVRELENTIKHCQSEIAQLD